MAFWATDGRRLALASAAALAAAMAQGCAPRGPIVVTDPDPSQKIPAIEIAVDRHDKSVVPQMIKDLDSDDAAVRFYSITGLEKLTGYNFGYRYFDPRDQREPAVKQWQLWLKRQPATSH